MLSSSMEQIRAIHKRYLLSSILATCRSINVTRPRNVPSLPAHTFTM
jgi:hypothetical protein